MADINGVNNSTQSIDGSSKSSAGVSSKNGSLGQEDFMKLLVAQLSYQDPMQPQENGDFIAQMAQFGTVSGVQELQKSFESLSASLQSNQALQASTLVGRKVEVKADGINIESGQSFEGSVEVSTPTQNMTLSVYNDAGEKVNSVAIGNAGAGYHKFEVPSTDSKGNPLPAGHYSIKVEGQVGNQTVAQSTYLAANVDSVTLGKDSSDITLSLAGLGQVKIGDIREIS